MGLLEEVGKGAVLRLLEGQEGQGAFQFAQHIRVVLARLRHLRLGKGQHLLDLARAERLRMIGDDKNDAAE